MLSSVITFFRIKYSLFILIKLSSFYGNKFKLYMREVYANASTVLVVLGIVLIFISLKPSQFTVKIPNVSFHPNYSIVFGKLFCLMSNQTPTSSTSIKGVLSHRVQGAHTLLLPI